MGTVSLRPTLESRVPRRLGEPVPKKPADISDVGGLSSVDYGFRPATGDLVAGILAQRRLAVLRAKVDGLGGQREEPVLFLWIRGTAQGVDASLFNG